MSIKGAAFSTTPPVSAIIKVMPELASDFWMPCTMNSSGKPAGCVGSGDIEIAPVISPIRPERWLRIIRAAFEGT